MITDNLRDWLALQMYTELGSAQGDLGLGGNSTNPASNTLDVPLSQTSNITVTRARVENTVEIKLTMNNAGSYIAGKVIREAGVFDTTETPDQLWIRESFEGIGPFSTTERLEITFIVEVE